MAGEKGAESASDVRTLTATSVCCGSPHPVTCTDNYRSRTQVAEFETPTILSGGELGGEREHIKHTMYDDLQVNIYTNNNEWLR